MIVIVATLLVMLSILAVILASMLVFELTVYASGKVMGT